MAEAVQAARAELDLTQDEFAQRAGLSIITVQRVEAGKVDPRTKTFSALDRGAQWPAGTARAILLSGADRPPSVPRAGTETIYDPASNELDQEAALRRLIELLPSIRKGFGNDEADKMLGRIMMLAGQTGLSTFVSSELQKQSDVDRAAG